MKIEIIFIDEETLTEEEVEGVWNKGDTSEVPERFAEYAWEVSRYGQATE